MYEEENNEFPIEYSDFDLYGETKEDVEKNLLNVNRSRFRSYVEGMMLEEKLSILDAIFAYCEEYNVDVEDVQSFIDGNVKSKLEEYAIVHNLLKHEKNSSQLPI